MDNDFEKISVWEKKRKNWYKGDFCIDRDNYPNDKLKEILLKCVAEDPKDRFRDACSLQHELQLIRVK